MIERLNFLLYRNDSILNNNNNDIFSFDDNSNKLIEELEIDEKLIKNNEIENNQCIICYLVYIFSISIAFKNA